MLEWRGFPKERFSRKMVDLGIVIVNYNTRDLLRICLRSVCASQGDFTLDVCVVDNGSPDGSAEMVAAEFPQVHLIANDANQGFAAAVWLPQDSRLSTSKVCTAPERRY